MVAIVSGTGLGLFNTSASNNLIVGNANTGRSGEQVYVNSATGNLVVRDQDERLAALGLDLALVRTYNSQGLIDGDNNDNWRIGFYRRVSLNGTANATGSTVTKTFGDGAEVVYTFDGTKYVSSDGDGAHDTLAWNGSEWTWTDGSTRNTETYNSAGQLVNARDTDGNAVSFIYADSLPNSLLTRVTTTSGSVTQSVYLDYTGNNLSQVRAVEVNGAQTTTQTLTQYFYYAD